jgi:acetyltransferase-like isoleucine patch superfamily enzyme
MTEREKMEQGMLYLAGDPQLLQERLACQDLCWEYNHLRPSQLEQRREILKKLLGKTGERFHIEQDFHCDYGYHITLGEDFYANYHCVMLDCAPITFGDRVLVGPGCGFYTAGHPMDLEQRNQGWEYAHPITVGDDVWFGAQVAVLPGVTIGSDVVIGAGSVVTHDIPSGVIAAGNPCRVLREITEEDRQKYKIR